LLDRESKMSTGIMHGIAVPHGSCDSIHGCFGAVGVSRKGIDYESLDNEPVYLVFMFLFGTSDNELHLSVLRDLAVVLQNPAFVEELKQKQTPQELYDFLCGFQS